MKPIETETTFHGHTLRRIWRTNDVAVYARSLKPNLQPHEVELIFIKEKQDRVMPNGEMTLAHEAYPSPSEWGKSGFSFPVRHKDAVLALAAECSGILEGRAALVKERRSQMGS